MQPISSIRLFTLLIALVGPALAQGGATTAAAPAANVAVSSDPVDPAVYNAAMIAGKDLSGIPAGAVRAVGSGVCANVQCGPDVCDRCFETCGNCPTADDIYGCPKAKEWALTFDDGPSQYTGELLDTLKKTNVTAAFFVMGGHVAKYASFVKRAHAEGHLIASHTWSHPHLMSLTNEQVIAEIKMTEDAIVSAIGVRPKYIRPPYGEADARIKGIFKAFGYRNVLWNMDTTDYATLSAGQDKAKIYQSFVDSQTKDTGLNAKNDPGFISLQHDVYQDSINQEETIISYLRQQSHNLVSIATCINDPTPYWDAKTGAPISSTTSTNATTIPKSNERTDVENPGAVQSKASSVGSSTGFALVSLALTSIYMSL